MLQDYMARISKSVGGAAKQGWEQRGTKTDSEGTEAVPATPTWAASHDVDLTRNVPQHKLYPGCKRYTRYTY